MEMVITQKQVKIELDSSCTCTDEYGQWAGECFGCWQENLDIFNEMLTEWKTVVGYNDDTNDILIQGTAMGWQRRSGFVVVLPNDITSALHINGDYRLVFTFDNDSLTCVRYSHDEPTGASFTITLHTSEEAE